MTPEWLTGVLRVRFPDVTVDRIEVVQAIWGTASKLRIRATYSNASVSGGPPQALCIKGGLDRRWHVKIGHAIVKRSRLFDPSRAYRIEAGFYNDLAPALDAAVPGCWFAAADARSGQGILVLEDLVAAGATFGDPTVAWSADQVAVALELQAAWHAASWGQPRASYPWLPAKSIIGDLTPVLLSPVHWNTHFRLPRAPSLPPALDDRPLVLAALKRMWGQHAVEAVCISHGDAHVGNTYFDAAGRPAFLDWQGVCLGPPLDDVSYFLTGALTIEDRRAHERDLLDHYLAVLAARGAPAPSRDEAWNAYRRYSLHGFLWAVTPPIMQAWKNVRAMSERHLSAIVELDALEAVKDGHDV